ncbi:MAG: nuclear transport factor 2 family protein [Alphaproteobacteria bacterium]|nr:nuclear transport factor 2 family protein [Alphaproteobacteria bacterium]
MADREALLFANEAFYRAFCDRDIDALDALWAQAEPVLCIHPGWPALVGRDEVMASWTRILANPDAPKIECRDPHVHLLGDVGMVVCYEVIEGQALVATNIFRREGRTWKLVHHHAGPAPAPPETKPEAAPRPN